MIKYSIFTLLAVCSLSLADTGLKAQSKACNIKGALTNVRLKNGKLIKKVYLNRLNGDGSLSLVDSSMVRNNSFAFNRKMDEQPMIHTVSGFDNGSIRLFVESGTVNVKTDAASPQKSVVGGTVNNEILAKYLALGNKLADLKLDKNKISERAAVANSQYFVDVMRLIFENHESPLAPFLMNTEILPQLQPGNALKHLSKWAHPSVKNHPYTEALSNQLLTENFYVGSFAPTFTLNTADGKTIAIKDLKGKYVFVDFWESGNADAVKRLPFLKELYAKTKDDAHFVLLSISLDRKKETWKSAIAKHQLNNPGWVHASDLKGLASPSAKMFHVTSTPRSVLIDPEGRVIGLDLKNEQMVRTITKKLRTNSFMMEAEKLEDHKGDVKVEAKTNEKLIAMDFEQNDVNGKPVKLSDFRGKYVLLDFWASWCAPCRAENPNLLAAYNKFKDKNFTVLGVSLDKPGEREAWLDAIKKDGLTWTQVSDLRGWENAAVVLYGINSVPQNYLIGPDGTILARNLRGEALHKKLAELLSGESETRIRVGQ